jgi:hypothetical protein
MPAERRGADRAPPALGQRSAQPVLKIPGAARVKACPRLSPASRRRVKRAWSAGRARTATCQPTRRTRAHPHGANGSLARQRPGHLARAAAWVAPQTTAPAPAGRRAAPPDRAGAAATAPRARWSAVRPGPGADRTPGPAPGQPHARPTPDVPAPPARRWPAPARRPRPQAGPHPRCPDRLAGAAPGANATRPACRMQPPPASGPAPGRPRQRTSRGGPRMALVGQQPDPVPRPARRQRAVASPDGRQQPGLPFLLQLQGLGVSTAGIRRLAAGCPWRAPGLRPTGRRTVRLLQQGVEVRQGGVPLDQGGHRAQTVQAWR